MGRGSYEVKARKGLIRMHVETSGGAIRSLSITGDFLLYPEDILWRIEERMRGVGLEEAPDALRRLFEELGARLVGASPQDFVEALRGALREAGGREDP